MEENKNINLSGGFFRRNWKKPRFYIPVALLAVAVLVIFGGGKGEPQYDLVEAKRSTLYEEVSVTGKTKAVESASLSFERAGKVVAVLSDVGDRVSAGQPLVRLDATSDVLELNQAEATLEADRALYNELLRGTRPEDIAVEESKVASAEQSLGAAKQNLLDKLRDSYTKADDAVRNYADQFFSNPRGNSPDLNISINDFQLETNLNLSRALIEQRLIAWQSDITAFTLNSNLLSATVGTREDLILVQNFMDNLSLAVNSLTSSQSLSATTISTYKTNVSTGRNAVSTALVNLSAAEDSLSSAVSALDLAEKNLSLAQAGTVSERIEAQEAKVKAGVARVGFLRYQISLATLYAPIGGVVAKQDAKLGEIVSVGQIISAIISDGGFEIEAYVPEVDIGSMVVGNYSLVTLDAFPAEEFEATVSYIEPAETIIDGVPTYKIKLSFESPDEAVRPGMTANLTVRTAERLGALSVPFRAIYENDGNKVVKVMTSNGNVEERVVEVGIRSSRGEMEILSGLNEGDIVAIDR